MSPAFALSLVDKAAVLSSFNENDEEGHIGHNGEILVPEPIDHLSTVVGTDHDHDALRMGV